MFFEGIFFNTYDLVKECGIDWPLETKGSKFSGKLGPDFCMSGSFFSEAFVHTIRGISHCRYAGASIFKIYAMQHFLDAICRLFAVETVPFLLPVPQICSGRQLAQTIKNCF